MSDDQHRGRSAWPLIAGFAVLAVLIAAAGYWAWRQQSQSMQREAERSLVAVGKLKTGQITSWLDERHADAQMLHTDPLLSAATADLLAGRRAAAASADLQTFLDAFRRSFSYVEVVMTTPGGAVLLRSPQAATQPLGAPTRALVAKATATGAVQSSDLYPDAAGGARMDFVAPILGPRGSGPVIAAVALRRDPGLFLYPLIQDWPLPSKSGETLLVKRRGNQVVYLNELRFRKNTAFKLTLPLSRTAVPAVMAVRGRRGIAEGVDYRGVPVLAAVRPVPGTPWFIVAKEDSDEVLGAIRTRGWLTAGFTLLIVTLAGVGTLFWWRFRESQTTTAIRESEQKYRTLIENLSSGVVVHAPDTRILLSNSRASELLGLSAEQMQGRTAMDPHWRFVGQGGEPLPLERYPVNQVLASGEPLTNLVAGACRTERAAPLWLLCNGYPVRSLSGELLQIVITFVDISERVAAEQELRVSEHKFRETIQSLDEGYYSVRLDGVLLDHNPALNTILGCDREADMRGRNLPDFWQDPADRAVYLEQLTREGVIRDYLVKAKTANGIPLIVLVSAHLVRDERGEIARIDGTIVDFTARKAAEDEVARLNAELEQRVLERTAQLDVANKELEAFAYSVSHDLRAPLRHISGFSALLAERAGDGLDEKGLHYIDTISRSVREMGVLIDDLLLFSRTGRAELHVEDVDMDAVLAETLASLQQETDSREIEWAIAPLPHVAGDHALLRQVWANLLGNAVKFSRGRAPSRIEVGARDGHEAHEDVFWVRDNGVGFDMQYAHKLFGVFQRLHSSAEFEGTGIGLANVQRIIDRLGGRVWAEGEVDHGATFYFSLPRRKETPS